MVPKLTPTFNIIIITLLVICPTDDIPMASGQDMRYPITTQPDCVSTCGSLDRIAYPFGMNDPKCYADKWFEIECRNVSRGIQKPYLKQMNVEVTNINALQSNVEIMNPIFRSKCKEKDATPSVNLSGTPFVYSTDLNKFTAIGCNKIAFLKSNGVQVSGCVSLCDKYDNEQVQNDVAFGSNGGCLGRYCCETSLPLYLSEFKVTVDYMNDMNYSSNDPCIRALIGTENWNEVDAGGGVEYRSLKDLTGLDYVPAVLDWVILNSSASAFKLPSTSNCTVVEASQNRAVGWRCDCYGFTSFGDPYLDAGCVDGDSFGKDNRSKWAIVGVSSSLGSIILLVVLWRFYILIRKRMKKRQKEKFFKQNGGLLLQQRLSSGEITVDQAKLFSLRDLEKATDQFNMNRILGKGGQGTVYKGMLPDGKIVAVKKFKVQGNVEEFINEFVILSQINHRNVVKLLGCCLETEIPLLVYEFVPNGNLYEYLHGQNEDLPAMTWDMRLRMATEIAGALFYLHSIASQPIYHRDIKSTNILLDGKYRTKLADFGTSRIVSNDATHLTTVVQGTFGYLDPEYFHTSQLTEKSDVYSFGVVLVELLTGQKPISSIKSEEAKSLASYFVLSMDNKSLFDIIDKRIIKEVGKEHVLAVANLAYRCLELNGRKRPTMREVTLELERIRGSDMKNEAHQNLEEIEVLVNEVPWTRYSSSDTLPNVSSRTF